MVLAIALIAGLTPSSWTASAQTAPATEIVESPNGESTLATVMITPEDREQLARLEAAKRARTAALATIASEQANLAAFERELSSAEARLESAADRQALEAEATLGLRQQAVEARNRPARADVVYEDLRAELRTVRRHLRGILDAVSGQPSIPLPPASLTADLAPSTALEAASARRRSLEARRDRLAVRHQEDSRAEARVQLERLTVLNEARLELLPYLSERKRRAVTGFTPTAWNQVSAEFEHLDLILRYHAYVIAASVSAGVSDPSLVSTGIELAASGLVWILAFVAFAFWRNAAPQLLLSWKQDLQEENRAGFNSRPEPRIWLLQLFIAVRGPLEWLLVLFALASFLPVGVRSLLEVEVLGLIVGWVLVAALVTRLFSFLLGATTGRLQIRSRRLDSLRLRSMQLVSNVTVSFVLVLTLTDRLVGKGAFYHWVMVLGWPAAVATSLVLVRWWRIEVFEKLERIRRPNAMQRWVLAHRAGPTSPLAALIGTIDVLARALFRTARTASSRFASVRKTLAFLSRRELSRTDPTATSDLASLPDAAWAALSPETQGDVWIETRLQPAIDQLVVSASAGIMALVGERGSGKSASLTHLQQRFEDALRVKAVELTEGASMARSLSSSRVVLVEDVEALVHFDVGGLDRFDRLIDLARRNADQTLWILAVDSAAWALISRLRSIRTLFTSVIDLPRWSDADIAALLKARADQAFITPRYDRMIEDYADMDAIDRQEVSEAKHAAFMLLLWDASGGNPGVALHLWRSVMGVASDGDVFVRPLRQRPEAALEELSLEALFVYRAVLRQAGADLADLAAATNLPIGLVADVLRTGVGAGHMVRDGDTHRVSWDWYRPLVRNLARRQLTSAA